MHKAQPDAVMTFVRGDVSGLEIEINAQARSVAAAVVEAGPLPSVSPFQMTHEPEGEPRGTIEVFHFVLPKPPG